LSSSINQYPTYFCAVRFFWKYSSFNRFLLGFMALLFLNLSVNLDDEVPRYVAEDLSFNKQETIIELVCEKLLGFEDAFSEYEDNDTDEQTKSKNVKLNLYSQISLAYHFQEKPFVVTSKPRYLEDQKFLTIGYQQLDTPPPKV